MPTTPRFVEIALRSGKFRPAPRQHSQAPVIHDEAVIEKALDSFKRQSRSELEKLLENKLSPNAIVKGMTLLQHAAVHNAVPAATLLLSKKAQPNLTSPQNSITPAALAVRHNSFGVFKLLAASSSAHSQVMGEILKSPNVNSFLKEYLKYHSYDIRGNYQHLMTDALAERVPESVIVQLINTYRFFNHRDHRAVVHQALTSRYRAEVIKVLLDRRAPATGKEKVRYKSGNRWLTSWETTLTAAKKARYPNFILRLLRQKGAK